MTECQSRYIAQAGNIVYELFPETDQPSISLCPDPAPYGALGLNRPEQQRLHLPEALAPLRVPPSREKILEFRAISPSVTRAAKDQSR